MNIFIDINQNLPEIPVSHLAKEQKELRKDKQEYVIYVLECDYYRSLYMCTYSVRDLATSIKKIKRCSNKVLNHEYVSNKSYLHKITTVDEIEKKEKEERRKKREEIRENK